ncbi:mitotic checkpoint regulator, MAD2B-interacting-domain-containing protein [Irpex rosettiformis]|uniref:Mitotic checkpoint regulator, MAD2B-interacting-domain-containing protein n=1 Tax=Irpex rosettiformis TaxID=378272 RepID=A0ACB8UI87_9APHY|nr:mitotic checkpoint regulator, MAD2B-interacting-domain-containing protein [Irpex rosettiformis]
MLGVEGYGSDSDSENDTSTTSLQPTSISKPPAAQKKTGLSLPSPISTALGPKASSGLYLPVPKKKVQKKIAIGLPELSNDNERDDNADDQPPAKKPRIETSGGSSSLFSMLPAPKNKDPVPERVLGGGKGRGLVFNAGVRRPPTQPTVEDVEEEHDETTSVSLAPLSGSILEDATLIPESKPFKPAAVPFVPPSLARGKANVSTEDRPTLSKTVSSTALSKHPAPAADFFSLGSPSTSSIPSISISQESSSSMSSVISSAPKIEEFVPPESTANDPYPGYYLLPTGSWAAYDPAYYQKFYKKWKKEYDDHVRALEKGIEKGFQGAEDSATEVNALKEMERARKEVQEREEKKALTMGTEDAPVAPKMNIKGAALSGRAKTRHQLSTLLTDAYQNREALEEQIAMARRNRKEAGNKYGF